MSSEQRIGTLVSLIIVSLIIASVLALPACSNVKTEQGELSDADVLAIHTLDNDNVLGWLENDTAAV